MLKSSCVGWQTAPGGGGEIRRPSMVSLSFAHASCVGQCGVAGRGLQYCEGADRIPEGRLVDRSAAMKVSGRMIASACDHNMSVIELMLSARSIGNIVKFYSIARRHQCELVLLWEVLLEEYGNCAALLPALPRIGRRPAGCIVLWRHHQLYEYVLLQSTQGRLGIAILGLGFDRQLGDSQVQCYQARSLQHERQTLTKFASHQDDRYEYD